MEIQTAFCNLQSKIKSKNLSIFNGNLFSLSKDFGKVLAVLTELNTNFFVGITKSRISKFDFSPTI